MGVAKLAFGVLKLIYGPEWLAIDTIQCYFFGFEIQWTLRAEINVVMIISAMRYLIVCHNLEKSALFWGALVALSCLPVTGFYTYALVMLDMKPSSARTLCQSYNKPVLLSTVFNNMLPFFFLFPCWIITYCYFAVGYKVNQKLNQMKRQALSNNNTQLLQAVKKQKLKIFIQLIMVFILYNANFAISYITHILKFAIGYKRTNFVEAMSFICLHTTTSLNSAVTINFQPELYNEFASMLFTLKLKLKKSFSRFFTRN